MQGTQTTDTTQELYRAAFGLALFTIIYNVLEGVVSIFFGVTDESLSLFGFGADSYIEVISGIGIAHMVIRIRRSPGSSRDDFERRALRVTGFAFYLLVVTLVSIAVLNLLGGHEPVTTFWGVVISAVSIIVMWALVAGKMRVGRKLNSAAIKADASCTKVCIWMSLVLLGSSLVYMLTRFPYVDELGTLGLAWFSFSEGRECFEKAQVRTTVS